MSKLKTTIETKLENMGKPIKYSGQNFIMTTCLNPVHQDSTPSFSINVETGSGFCFSCGFSTGLRYWGLDGADAEELERQRLYRTLKRSVHDEPHFLPTVLPPVDQAIETDFRHIPADFLKRLGCYITTTGKYAGRIIFPVYLKDELLGFDSRAIGDAKPKYLRSRGFSDADSVYPYLLLKEFTPRRIYVAEGILDAISGWVLGIPCVCNWGLSTQCTSTKAKELTRLGVEEVVILVDNDEAGAKGRDRLEKSYGEYFTIISPQKDKIAKEFYDSDYKDLNEMLGGKNEMV